MENSKVIYSIKSSILEGWKIQRSVIDIEQAA